MLHFDPHDPFPLLGESNYSEEQTHSEAVDHWLGLKTEEIEASLRADAHGGGQEPWIGLPVKSLLTPYTEIRSFLAKLDPREGATIVDLGAGYGRMGFVVGKHYPHVQFLGYELVPERVAEALRCLAQQGYANVNMEVADLASSTFNPAVAEFYFIYDFGSRVSIEKCLQDLRRIARDRPITVVGRGRASRDSIERKHPWLSQVNQPEHHGNFSIYRSK